MKQQDGYNIGRVHKVNLLVVTILVCLICGQVLLTEGWKEATIPLIAGASIVLISIGNFYIPINRYVKGLLFAVLPALVIFALIFADGYNINKHYMLIVTIAMVTLYFKKELIVAFGVIYNIGVILCYRLVPANFLSSDANLKGFITVFTLINGILLLLYFLTKWGSELVEKATQKETEARSLLDKLESTFQTVEMGAQSLNSNINTVDQQLKGISSASLGIVDSVQQMATAIGEEAASVYKINETMSQSLQVVNQTIHISKGIVTKSDRMSKKVENGWSRINEVSRHMDTVNSAIGTATTTVNELKFSLEEINSLLNGIKAIAGQTN